MKIIQNIDELPMFERERTLVCDTETTGLYSHLGNRICGISIGPFKTEEGYYIPVRHQRVPTILCEPGKNLFEEEYQGGFKYANGQYVNLDSGVVFDWMRALMADADRTWVFQNVKFDLKMFRAEGVECVGRIVDTLLVAHAHNSNNYSFSLDALTKRYVSGFKHVRYIELKKWFMETFKINLDARKYKDGTEPPNYAFAPVDILGNYALEDLDATRKVARSLDDSKNWLDASFNQGNSSWKQKELAEHECELVKVIFEMEDKGVLIDCALLGELSAKTEDQIRLFSNRLFSLAKYQFNFSSTKQVASALADAGGEVLFWNKPEFKNRHKFPNLTEKEFAGKQKKDKFTEFKKKSTGNPCFNSSSIAEYLKIFRDKANENAFNFIYYYWSADHRKRIKNTYLDGISKMLDFNNVLHGSFNQSGTVHGRFSSSGPNLQNIAKSEGNRDLKMIEGILNRKDTDAINRQIRKLFIPRPGYTWVCIDWKQIEYLVATYFSCDEDMIKLFYENANLDYHQVTADMAKIDRDTAKTVNFGVLYGIGANSLSSLLEVPLKEAKSVIEKVYNSRPALKRLIFSVQDEVRRNGFVQNPLGRRVRVDRDKAYVGLNYLVAGTVGDLMKERMIAVFDKIQKRNWQNICHMLLTVHDELDFEIRTERVEEVAPVLAETMCDVKFIKMPVRCDIEVGRSWGEIEDLQSWLKKREELYDVKA